MSDYVLTVDAVTDLPPAEVLAALDARASAVALAQAVADLQTQASLSLALSL